MLIYPGFFRGSLAITLALPAVFNPARTFPFALVVHSILKLPPAQPSTTNSVKLDLPFSNRKKKAFSPRFPEFAAVGWQVRAALMSLRVDSLDVRMNR